MNNSFIYNPRTYTLSAMVIGYLMIGSYSANEQNAIGNWFMTIGQILESNSAIQQALEEVFQGNTYNINSNTFKNGGNPNCNNKAFYDILKNSNELNNIEEVIKKILDLINDIKK